MIGMLEKLEETVAFVRQRTASRPTVGVILGSGLGQLVERMEDATAIDYCDVPHFPAPTVAGHAGRMVFGRIGKVDVNIQAAVPRESKALLACLDTFEDFCVVTQSVREGMKVNVNVEAMG